MDNKIWMEALLSSVGFTYDLNLDNSLMEQNKTQINVSKFTCINKIVLILHFYIL